MKRVISLVLALFLLLSFAACGGETEEEGGCALYYLTAAEQSGGDAVAAEYCELFLPEEPARAAKTVLERYWEDPRAKRSQVLSPEGCSCSAWRRKAAGSRSMFPASTGVSPVWS